jgi:predicted ribosomally synthesized peptide with nif11-like leader
MSKESVEAFVKRLSDDKQLEQQLQAEAKDVPDQVAVLVSLANRNGFEFTAEEFLAAVPEGQLSDEELEGVAGGTAAHETFVVRRTRSLADFGLVTQGTPTLGAREQE